MTASYTMPLHRRFRVKIRSHRIDPSKIAVIVPTYKDWGGLRITLDSLMSMVHKPKEIFVVNDNESRDVPEWLSEYPISLINYDGNRGPAYARNAGFGLLQKNKKSARQSGNQSITHLLTYGIQAEHDLRLRKTILVRPVRFSFTSECQWFYFTDCGCTHDPNLFMHFSMPREREGDSVVALCGATEGVGDGLINQYMTHQGILNPPLEEFMYGKKVAQSIITCNTLICGLAFSYLKGFDTNFPEAAAEDLDMGIRLRELGMIGFEPNALVRHKFDEDISDFKNRFERYGRGLRRLEVKHNLSSLRPVHINADRENLQEFADLQCKHMQIGYDSVALQDGMLGILEEPIHSAGERFRSEIQGLGEDPFAERSKSPDKRKTIIV